MAGYSDRSLAQKLGIKAGMTVIAINQPPTYRRLLGRLPQGTRLSERVVPECNFIHFFAIRRRDLETRLPILRKKLADTGTLWVSWPKKSARVLTDVTEDVIREVALPIGLVDTKVCAVDETWSGLKLMIRRENRKSTTGK
jgi:Protein of unknown function (DUF3052)